MSDTKPDKYITDINLLTVITYNSIYDLNIAK